MDSRFEMQFEIEKQEDRLARLCSLHIWALWNWTRLVTGAGTSRADLNSFRNYIHMLEYEIAAYPTVPFPGNLAVK